MRSFGRLDVDARVGNERLIYCIIFCCTPGVVNLLSYARRCSSVIMAGYTKKVDNNGI